MPLWLATVVAVVVVACLPAVSVGCFIQGQDSGECQEPEEFKADMEFCGNVVTYRACVPKENPLWPKHDVFNKDKSIVDERIRHETNETLMDEGINELGEEGEVEVRFFENDDCIDAFKNYFCWLNFPRCDDEQNSLIMCRSACENLMEACNVRVCLKLRACVCVRACTCPLTDARFPCCLLASRSLALTCAALQYATDLHRCGPPEFFGGAEAEVDDILDEDGNPIYWRAHWPGQPFRDNVFAGDDEPVVVCTPSIKNAAAGGPRSRVRDAGMLRRLVPLLVAALVAGAAAVQARL